jgi:hypothetical protein
MEHPMERKSHEAALERQDEVRCRCGYFLCERIFCEGRAVLKLVCKSCRRKLLVTLTPESAVVGLV